MKYQLSYETMVFRGWAANEVKEMVSLGLKKKFLDLSWLFAQAERLDVRDMSLVLEGPTDCIE